MLLRESNNVRVQGWNVPFSFGIYKVLPLSLRPSWTALGFPLFFKPALCVLRALALFG